MPATQIFVKSPEELSTELEECFKLEVSQKLILLFEGSTDTTGDSWSEHCRKHPAGSGRLSRGLSGTRAYLDGSENTRLPHVCSGFASRPAHRLLPRFQRDNYLRDIPSAVVVWKAVTTDCRLMGNPHFVVEALLEPMLESAPGSKIFLMAEVGKENEWNDAANFFKQHSTYKLTEVPTILLMSGPTTIVKRLEGDACLDQEKLAELF